jgi:hypothetical protein
MKNKGELDDLSEEPEGAQEKVGDDGPEEAPESAE